MAIPKLRFKREDGTGYPAWEEKALREVGFFIRGVTYGKDNVTTNPSATLVLRSNNIKENKTLNYNDDLQFVNKEPKAEQILKENDIVICMANGSNRLVGKTAQYDGKYPHTITVGAFCGIFRCNLPIIRYTFQSPNYSTFLLLNLQGGDGAIANLKGEDILSFTTYFPSLEEQQKIADFLSAVDEVITHSKAEVQNLEKQKKAVMQKIFSQEVRFKREDGTGYPEWEILSLGNVASVKVGEKPTKVSETPSLYEYINAGTTNSGYTNSYNCEGDTVTTPSRGQGGIGFVGYQNKPFWLGSLCYKIQSCNKNVATKYIYFVLTQHSSAITDLKKVGSIPAINKDDLIQITLPFPCLEEQQKIADFLYAYDEAISYAKQELKYWKQLKKGLLQQMFV